MCTQCPHRGLMKHHKAAFTVKSTAFAIPKVSKISKFQNNRTRIEFSDNDELISELPSGHFRASLPLHEHIVGIYVANKKLRMIAFAPWSFPHPFKPIVLRQSEDCQEYLERTLNH